MLMLLPHDNPSCSYLQTTLLKLGYYPAMHIIQKKNSFCLYQIQYEIVTISIYLFCARAVVIIPSLSYVPRKMEKRSMLATTTTAIIAGVQELCSAFILRQPCLIEITYAYVICNSKCIRNPNFKPSIDSDCISKM